MNARHWSRWTKWTICAHQSSLLDYLRPTLRDLHCFQLGSNKSVDVCGGNTVDLWQHLSTQPLLILYLPDWQKFKFCKGHYQEVLPYYSQWPSPQVPGTLFYSMWRLAMCAWVCCMVCACGCACVCVCVWPEMTHFTHWHAHTFY